MQSKNAECSHFVSEGAYITNLHNITYITFATLAATGDVKNI